jgi:hypothetical protein
MSTSSTMRTTFFPLRSSAGKAAPVQPPMRRPFIVAAAGARRVLATKWFVPSGLEVPIGGNSSPEEGIRATFPCSSAVTL